jgi:hypothetical protein
LVTAIIIVGAILLTIVLLLTLWTSNYNNVFIYL